MPNRKHKMNSVNYAPCRLRNPFTCQNTPHTRQSPICLPNPENWIFSQKLHIFWHFTVYWKIPFFKRQSQDNIAAEKRPKMKKQPKALLVDHVEFGALIYTKTFHSIITPKTLPKIPQLKNFEFFFNLGRLHMIFQMLLLYCNFHNIMLQENAK